MEEGNESLHVVVLPWLAMGHILPFFELSRRLASKDHHVSFLTTRKNIDRLEPKIPHHLSHLLTLVEFTLPHIENLPESVENTVDLTEEFHRQYLQVAFDSFEEQFSDFLRNRPSPPPDWVIYDYAAYWVPDIVDRHGIPCAYISLFSAAALGFFGPLSKPPISSPKDLTNVPDWIPFPTTVAFLPFEARALFKPGVLLKASGTSQSLQFAKGIEKCPFMLIRSCNEFEGAWIELLNELYQKPVIPIGLFPPPAPVESKESSQQWATAYKWLEIQEPGSVVYAAFGSEAQLTSTQVNKIAIGLDQSGLRFVWVLREGSPLPEGFEARTVGRGIVCKGWVPQVQFLTHPSVGGFLTHGGWNSIVEGLTIGLPMVILPMLFDQGLNARNLVDQGIAVEVPRDLEDGSFEGEGVSKCLRMVMVDEEGERFRAKARECKKVLGDEELHDRYIEGLVKYLWDHGKQTPQPLKL
nr:UDP-glucosyltransferase 91AH2 [Paris polyphylla]